MRPDIFLKLMFTLCLMGSVHAEARASRDTSERSYQLKVRCRAQLLSTDGQFEIRAESKAFSPTIDGFALSGAKLHFGPYTLIGSMSQAQPYGSSALEPTFGTMLFANGNPVQGNIQSSAIQGLDLSIRSLNTPLTLYSSRFLTFSYEGKDISRVDYSCSITKIL